MQDEDEKYPSLPQSATVDQKLAAIEEYASKKKLRGMTIKDHCKRITREMPSKENPSIELKNLAMQLCEGVMTMNFTKNKHGIDAKIALESIEKKYKKNSTEYRYLEQTANLAYSESS
ncbi:hypothetical protein [Erwinia sp. V71]|uniref:hypothetical protein n=1 Tax=Erwinia sp. V71 TaxID=3369424 RepID=UPI003F61361E